MSEHERQGQRKCSRLKRYEFPDLIICLFLGNHTELFRGKGASQSCNLVSDVSGKTENYKANVVKCYHLGNVGEGNVGFDFFSLCL